MPRTLYIASERPGRVGCGSVDVDVRARVIHVGLEQCRGRQQSLIEELPLCPDLHAARALRWHADKEWAETIVLRTVGVEFATNRALRGRIGGP
jgi:hypothetical protein